MQPELMQHKPLRVAKILLCVTEDWFVLSHFKALIRALGQVADEVVVATRMSGRGPEIEAIGARVVDFDYSRSSTHPVRVAQTAAQLRALIAAEQPNAVHVVALKPIVLSALALLPHRKVPVAVHLTGLGLLGASRSWKGRAMRSLALQLVGQVLRRERSHLFVENRHDLARVPRQSLEASSVLGGAGVDPEHFQVLPEPAVPNVAFAGRMIRSKGVDVLVDASRRLKARGHPVMVGLYGKIDEGNPEAYTREEIAGWEREGLARWQGHIDDVREIWRELSHLRGPLTRRRGFAANAAGSGRHGQGSGRVRRAGLPGFRAQRDRRSGRTGRRR